MKKITKNVKSTEVENINNEVLKKEEEKRLKKQEQNKRVWMSCEVKGHFGCMIPNRYINEMTKDKLVCPICQRKLKSKIEQIDDTIELVANN